jgi:hypothetical protein
MRPGETHQHAAIVDPFVEAVERIGNVADVGKDQHRQMTVQEARDRLRRREAFGEADIGKWIKCASEVIGGADERLRTVGCRARHHANGSPAPSLVKQLDGACRTLPCDLEPCHVVSYFHRQVDHSVGLTLAGLETERRLAKRETFEIDRIHRADIARTGLRAQHLHGQCTGRIVRCGERVRYGQATLDNSQRTIADDALEPLDESGSLAEVGAV